MPRILDPVEKARNAHIRREAERRQKANKARARLREAALEGVNMYGEDSGSEMLDSVPEADQDFLGQTFFISPSDEHAQTRVIELQRNSNGGFSWKDMLNDAGEWNATFITSFGTKGTGNGQFTDGIRGIDINPANGDVYVSSGTGPTSKIQQFTANGSYIDTIATYGSGAGQVDEPWGIGISQYEDNLFMGTDRSYYVADKGNNRVLWFRVDYGYVDIDEVYSEPVYDVLVSRFGTVEDVAEEPQRSLSKDSTGKRWKTLSTDEVRVIQAFSSTDRFQFGSKGSAPGQFNEPLGIRHDEDDLVYVADSKNHRIQVFDRAGIPRGAWGQFGVGEGEFDTPTALVITTDYIYVADSGNSRVQIFTNPIESSSLTGTIQMWVFSEPPFGWAMCNGQAIPRDSRLGAKLVDAGMPFGSGDGSTTVNLPDFMGRTPYGRVEIGSSLFASIGQTGGAETHTLTGGESGIQSHNHSINLAGSVVQRGTASPTANTASQASGSTANSGFSSAISAHNNMPPYLVVYFIIKL